MSTSPNISVNGGIEGQSTQEAGRNEAYAEGQMQAKGAAFDDKYGENALEHHRKPVTQLSNQEIVREARDLHSHFQQLAERYEQAPPAQRAEIREEMQPYVNRERELRQEYTGRISPEISQDRVPDQQIGYSR